MTNQDILNYLKQFSETGRSIAEAKKILINVGWEERDVDEAIKEFGVSAIGEKTGENVSQLSPQIESQKINPQSFSERSPRQTLQDARGGFQVADEQNFAGGDDLEEPSLKKKSHIGLVLGIVLGVLVVGGSAFGAYQYWRGGLLGGGKKASNEILNDAFEKMWNLKTYRSEMVFSADYKGEGFSLFPDYFIGSGLHVNGQEETEGNFSLMMEGMNDMTDLDFPKGAYNFKLVLDMQGLPELDLDAEMVFLGDVFYLKSPDIWDLLAGSVFMTENSISDLPRDQWIKFDYKDFMEGGLIGKSFKPTADQLSGVAPEIRYSDGLAMAMGPFGGFSSDMVSGQISKLRDILKNKDFYIVESELPEEQVNGVDSYRFRVSFNKEVFKEAVVSYMEAVYSGFFAGMDGEDFEMTDEMKVDMTLAVEEMVEKGLLEIGKYLTFSEHDVWVEKENGLIPRTSFVFKVEDPEGFGVLNANLSVVNSGFNEFVDIQEPQDAKNFVEVLSGLGWPSGDMLYFREFGDLSEEEIMEGQGNPFEGAVGN